MLNRPCLQPNGVSWLVLAVVVCGSVLFLWRLGAVGQLDETPALFAAAGRAMAETGDWLTPRVNGHPRFDKPVLIYWLIGGFNWLLPPRLGSLGRLGLHLALRPGDAGDDAGAGPHGVARRGAVVALEAALAFALSPLVLLWGGRR